GAAQSIAWPNTVLNTIAAESLGDLADEIEAKTGPNPDPKKLEAALMPILQKIVKAHKRVIFDGDNYTDEWQVEAKRRGLPNHRNSSESLDALTSNEVVSAFERFSVLKRVELEARRHIFLEQFCKNVQIEANTLVGMCRQSVAPAAQR